MSGWIYDDTLERGLGREFGEFGERSGWEL